MNIYEKKNVWIIGASTGIGKSLALRWLNYGHSVTLSSRSVKQLEELKAGLTSSQQEFCQLVPVDVTDSASIRSAYDEVFAWKGLPDIMLYNAGTHQHMPVNEFNADVSRSIIETNLIGAVHFTDAVLPDILKNRRGHLVFTGSLAGYRGLPFAAAYGAGKAGLINFVESIRFELEKHGVTVTLINPGFVKTPMTDRNPFEMPELITSEEAATYIIEGLKKGKKEIHFPPKFSWIMKFLRILPYSIYHWLISKKTVGSVRE